MAGVGPVLILRIPGDVLAHEVMRVTLKEIAKEAEPWSGNATTSAGMALEALRAVDRLEGTGDPVHGS